MHYTPAIDDLILSCSATWSQIKQLDNGTGYLVCTVVQDSDDTLAGRVIYVSPMAITAVVRDGKSCQVQQSISEKHGHVMRLVGKGRATTIADKIEAKRAQSRERKHVNNNRSRVRREKCNDTTSVSQSAHDSSHLSE